MRRLVLIPVGAAMVALAGCGSSTPASPSTPAPSSSGGGLQTQSSGQVLTAAQGAFAAATSVQAKGNGTADGKPIDFSLQLQKSGELQGTFSQGSSVSQVVAAGGSLYVKLDSATVEQKFGQEAAAAVGDKWIKTTSDNPDSQSLTSLTFSSFSDSLNKVTAQSDAPVATTISGQPVVTIVLANGNRLSVANSGPAYPVQLVESSAGTIDFSNYNSVPPITAPTDFVNLSDVEPSASPTPTS